MVMASSALYPPSDGDGAGDADGVVGPYPPSDDGDGDDAGGVVGPYPPSDEGDDHSEDVVGPHLPTGENMDGSSCNVTGPYPPMPVGNAMDPAAPVGPMAAAVKAPPPPAPLQPVVSEPPRRWEPPGLGQSASAAPATPGSLRERAVHALDVAARRTLLHHRSQRCASGHCGTGRISEPRASRDRKLIERHLCVRPRLGAWHLDRRSGADAGDTAARCAA